MRSVLEPERSQLSLTCESVTRKSPPTLDMSVISMDLYGHMIDRNLWDAAQRLGGTTGARPDDGWDDERGASAESRR
jgi:hypothetical protein